MQAHKKDKYFNKVQIQTGKNNKFWINKTIKNQTILF